MVVGDGAGGVGMKYQDVCVGSLKTDPLCRTFLVKKDTHSERILLTHCSHIHIVTYNPLPFAH